MKAQVINTVRHEGIIIMEQQKGGEDQFFLTISGSNLKHVLQDLVAKRSKSQIHPSCVISGAKILHRFRAKMLEGLKCQGCVSSITSVLPELIENIHSIHVDIATKIVSVFSDTKLENQSIIDAINSINGKKAVMLDIVDDKFQSIIFRVEGMKCDGCVEKINNTLRNLEKVKSVQVDLKNKQVRVDFLSSESNGMNQHLCEIITSLGFKVSVLELEMTKQLNTIIINNIQGMKCGSCTSRIKEALLKHFENTAIDVQVELQHVTIVYNIDQSLSRDEAIDVIENLGYKVSDESTPTENRTISFSPVENAYNSQYVEIDLNDDDISPRRSLIPGNEFTKHVSVEVSSQIYKALVNIKGMSCASCVEKIERTVKKEDGVQQCVVNLMMERGEVEYDASLIDESSLVKSIESLGFQVSGITCRRVDEQYEEEEEEELRVFKVKFDHDAMTQEREAALIRAMQIRSNIIEFDINHDNCEIKLKYDDTQTNPRQIIRSLESIVPDCNLSIAREVDAHVEASKQQKKMRETILRTEEISRWRRLFIVSTIFTVPLMILSMIFGHIPATQEYLMYDFGLGLSIGAVTYWLLATPVQFYCGWPFYKLAFQALRHFSSDMNALIAIATTEAYFYSIFTIIYNVVMTYQMGNLQNMHGRYGGDNYFETSAALIMFLLLGRWLENIVKGKTSSALVKLMDLQPHMATVIEFETEDASKWDNAIHEYEVEVNEVQLGDILKVLPGSRMPVDGVIVRGTTTVDESMITGESLPVNKSENDSVIGGTVNLDGLLYVRATRTSGHSVLSSIAKLVEDAQTQKPKLQAIADRISSYFVPFVIALSALTLIVWLILGYYELYPADWRPKDMNFFIFALLFSSATVIIACPCSLGLATPTAVMVGTGIGALNGVLLKGGRSLETVSKATALLFDKTGTLTKGELKVTVEMFVGRKEERNAILQKIAAVESGSDHPIAKAVTRYVFDNLGECPNANVSDFINVSGRGVQCVIDGEIVNVGNQAFMIEKGISGMESLVSSVESDERFSHCTLVYAARNYTVEIVLGLTDIIKDESPAVVERLSQFYPRGKRNGPLKVYMLTGDNERAAHYIADEVGIPYERVFASLTPSGKSDKVRELQASGEVVMMIGDGINDSPSLAQADVGVSVASGTDVAIECADVVLMTNNLKSLVTAIDLSGVIYRRIVFNFVWAFLYNILAIPIAAGLFFPLIKIMIPPWVAGLAMVLSSVSVILSSLALRLYRKPNF